MGITIGSWVLIVIGIIFVIAGIIAFVWLFKDQQRGTAVIALIVCLVIGALLVFGPLVYSNTEAGERAYKDQESNFGGGISRTVTVYDVNGNVIKTYSGEFDIETDQQSYILFDDENGKRHIIYYTTGTITVDDN